MNSEEIPVDYRRSPSPGGAFPSPTSRDKCHLTEKPIRKNKRKRSDPKKRTDFSIKRFCPESPGSACSDSGRSEDTDINVDDSPRVPSVCPSDVLLPERTESRDDHHSDSNSNSSPPAHPGLLMFPGHFPSGFMIPNFHYKHPGIPFPLTQPGNSGQIPRVDLLQSASAYRHSGMSVVNNNNNNNVKQANKNNTNHNTNETQNSTMDNEMDDFNDTSRGGRKNRKNYKNMTRERRIEANARERTRVHTISAAFESLRRAVPSYSYNQKLSKLAILRIASSYIMSLGRLADIDDLDNAEDRGAFANCVDLCTRTIQTEGRARRRH